MIKDVLISIRPEWVDQIIAGKKIFEIRKSAEKYYKTLEQIKNGEIGIIKKRKHYKELYEEEQQYSYRLRMQYFELAKTINKIEELTEDKQILELIATLRK